MSFEERNTAVAIVTNLVVVALFVWRLSAMAGEGAFSGPDALAVWARAVLWLIAAAIGIGIGLTILFAILHRMLARGADTDGIVDERDRGIGHWGARVTLAVASAVFVGGLVALAAGWPALAALNLMLAGFAAGDMAGNLVKAVLYRRWG